MDRRLIAGMLGLWMTGCALSRSGSATAPVELGEVDTVPTLGAEALAKTYADRDAATRRAGQTPESPPIDDPSPGRPAPFAGRTTGTARAQADSAPVLRPAPFAGKTPTGPRPQAPSAKPVSPPSNPAPAADLAPANPAPVSDPSPPPEPAAPPSPFTESQAPKGKDATTDTQVQATSAVLPAASMPASPPPPPPPPPPSAAKGEPKLKTAAANAKVAMVGTEVITRRQVLAAIVEKKEKLGQEAWSKVTPAEKERLFRFTLDHLIDRALLVQAAKKKIKDMKAFNADIDRHWMETELPPLLREYHASSIQELSRKFASVGRSLDQMREEYRLDVLSKEFMVVQIKDKLRASFPEMTAFYEANRERFRRPAQVVWREIEVDIHKCADRNEARARADDLLARVRRGDDFARLARAASHGPTAREGGKWETAPGSSANADINAALAALAPGQVSGVIEAPGSFHVVRLESKREAGIAPFHEVQNQVNEELTVQKGNTAAEAVLETLRAKTVVTSIFDNPDLDPSAVKTGAKAAKPAGR